VAANDDAGMVEALRALGLLSAGERATTVPLSGGVSADVFAVRAASGEVFVVKRSIPRLRVAVDWRAPVTRDAVEVAWLRFVREVDPRLAPEVLAVAPQEHLFVMRYLEPATHPVWKQEMFAGRIDPRFAGEVGRDLARIHAAATARPQLADAFGADGFVALRTDPFLLFTAGRHPDVAERLRGLADDLARRKTTLIQGDTSPKNILVGPAGPVFLDAETAAWGDAAFDLAFCLTHLLLKSIWLAGHYAALMGSFDALRRAYVAGVDWEASDALGVRAAALVGALLLARVDGKSPSGYLDAPAEDEVRRRAKAILNRPGLDLDALRATWSAEWAS